MGTYGTLDPKYIPAPTTPYPVTVSALRTSGYLNATLPLNRYVNSTTLDGGYIVQFNQAAPSNRLEGGNKMGNIIIWTIQVSVPIRSNVPLAIVRALGADCAANATGSVVNLCSAGLPVNTGQTFTQSGNGYPLRRTECRSQYLDGECGGEAVYPAIHQ